MKLSAHFEFYHSIKPFTDFSCITEDGLYHDIPSNWTLVLTDIQGSTQAIKEGRSKEVNLIGAATISCLVNLIGTHDLPFVFGGDGATLLVPNAILEPLLNGLKKLKTLARHQFHLELRIGYAEIDALKSLQQEFKVAKYELSPGNYLAQFKGGALTFAENLIKSKDPRARLIEGVETSEAVQLKGLSCRLNPLKSVQGKILTLLCKPVGIVSEEKSVEVLRGVLNKLVMILNNDLKSAAPVRLENLSWPVPAARNEFETKMNTRYFPFFLKWLMTFLYASVSNMSLKYGLRMGKFIPSRYKKELQLNSDFKKFDETLRMVLDCTPPQIEQIQSLLEDLQKQNLIVYGVHISDEALMTCIVLSPTSNKHIHFIDGANGGYTMAAVQMKKQMQSAPIKAA